ncbi:type IV secretion system protein [Avibacterium paragallinarum]|uniref:Type IV secretion system protein n=1 Tax=Avibacterium paragallinarum TaxID=728 RepID=A0ABU7QSF7_AVIPA|nr:type IV secretion system protein [Avibacterium paragallinarum]
MSIVTELYTKIVTGFENNIGSYAQTIASTIKPLVAASFALYIIYIIYRMYSRKDAIYAEFFNMIFAFAIVGLFTYAGSAYYDTVVPFVKNAGEEIARKLIGLGTNSDSMTTVDTVYQAFEQAKDEMWKIIESKKSAFKADMVVYIEYALPIILIYLSQFIFTVAITINLLIAKIMVSLLLSVGIIFFIFACFPATRTMFTQWTGLALNYIFLNLLYSLSAIITADIFKTYISEPDNIIANSAIIFIATAIIVLALNQIPTLVSSLTGGVGISPYSVGNMMGGAAKMANLTKQVLFGSKGGPKGLVNGAASMGKKAIGAWKNRGSGKASSAK